MRSMRSPARVLLFCAALATLAALSGCRFFRGVGSCHGTQAYMNAKSEPPLKVPPGLEAPDTTNTLHLPQLIEPPPPPRKGKDPCLDEPPPYKVQQPKAPPQA